MNRDGKCLITGKVENLAADHLIPRREGGPDLLENLWTLYSPLHTQYTKDVRFNKDTPLRRRVDAARKQLIESRGLRPIRLDH